MIAVIIYFPVTQCIFHHFYSPCSTTGGGLRFAAQFQSQDRCLRRVRRRWIHLLDQRQRQQRRQRPSATLSMGI